MAKVIFTLQEKLNEISSHPLSFILAAVFLSGWLFGYFSSGGRFDPGLGIGNLIINGLGLILMFAACSLSQRAGQHQALHDKLDSLHDKVDNLNVG